MTSKLVKIEDLFINYDNHSDWARAILFLQSQSPPHFDIITFLDNLYNYGVVSTVRQRDYVLWGNNTINWGNGTIINTTATTSLSSFCQNISYDDPNLDRPDHYIFKNKSGREKK